MVLPGPLTDEFDPQFFVFGVVCPDIDRAWAKIKERFKRCPDDVGQCSGPDGSGERNVDRRTSEALRLQKQREASRWLALWITAAALAALAFLS